MAKGMYQKDGQVSRCKVVKYDGRTVINPSTEMLSELGWEPYVPPVAEVDPAAERMVEIERELADMDYLTSKYIDGEDMTQYGDWQGYRRALREEYRELEASRSL